MSQVICWAISRTAVAFVGVLSHRRLNQRSARTSDDRHNIARVSAAYSTTLSDARRVRGRRCRFRFRWKATTSWERHELDAEALNNVASARRCPAAGLRRRAPAARRHPRALVRRRRLPMHLHHCLLVHRHHERRAPRASVFRQ